MTCEEDCPCPDCTLYREACRTLRAPAAPPRLKANVLAALEKPRRPFWLVWGAAAACYLLLLLCLGWLASRPPAPEMLSPRLVRFWATAPSSPGPLEGGL